MGYVRALVLLMISAAGADGEQPKDAEVETIDPFSRTVKLVGVGYTTTRKHEPVARFVETKPNPGSEIILGFAPSKAETTVQRNHASTIRNIIFGSVSWRQERRTPVNEIDFHEPQSEIIFSIPDFTQGKVSNFDGWHLVSIKSPEAKQEPRQDAESGYGAGGGPSFAGPQNRVVQLVGVRFSKSNRHELHAKFVEFVPNGTGALIRSTRNLELGMMGDPIRLTSGQTTADVTHMKTMFNIIQSSVASTPLPHTRIDETQWREPLFQVFFSIPQDAEGNITDFSGWSLNSIKLPEAGKEQPKPTDK